MNDSAFDSWYNGMVGFHLNSERILDDLNHNGRDPAVVRKWMVVCWNSALEAAQDGLDYGWKTSRDNIEDLKEKP